MPIAIAHIVSPCLSLVRTESIAFPVRYGIRTVAPIAPKASANDQATPDR